MATFALNETTEDLRNVNTDILHALNLKIVNNLEDYVVLIFGINDEKGFSKILVTIFGESRVKLYDGDKESLVHGQYGRDTHIFLVTSGVAGRRCVPSLAEMPQLIAIYVYCLVEDVHAQWAKEFPKIRCSVSNTTQLVTLLQADIRQFSGRWPLGEATFLKSSTVMSEWYNLFLLFIRNRPENMEVSYAQMFDECRAYYSTDRNSIEQIALFEKKDKPAEAIREFTRDGFLYRIINHALRTRNMEIVRKFSPFIQDLHQQIHEHHQKYYRSHAQRIQVVYRGQ